MTWIPHTLSFVLQRNVENNPNALALITSTTRKTWLDIWRGAQDFAAALLASGIDRGDHVGLLSGNDEYWVEAFYGAALIGAVTVPINTRFKAADLHYCLEQADVRILIMTDSFLTIDFTSMVREVEPAVDVRLPGAQLPKLECVVVMGSNVPAGALSKSAFLEAGSNRSPTELEVCMLKVDPHDVLLIQFTSGTTAFPKGVMLSHENMLHNAAAVSQRIGLKQTDIYFNCRPFFHVAGSTLSLLAALETGSCLVTLATFEAGQALEMMMIEKCTFISGNETLFQLMLAHPKFDRSRLRLRGGWAAAGPETMQRIVTEMGIAGICSSYGQSEASPNVSKSDFRDPPEERLRGSARPLPGVEVRVVDTQGRILGPNTPGEIHVRGWNVMRGYYRQPELTRQAFTDDGWLRTGDMGVVNEGGYLRFLSRLKDLFRVGGENVAPAEVEAALLLHPSVASAQVVGVPDERLGEVPAAYVTLRHGEILTPDSLMSWAKPRMANFRIPRYIAVVEDFERIGMTASGKVQKNKLLDDALNRFGLLPSAHKLK